MVWKTAPTARTATTTLTDDPDLICSLPDISTSQGLVAEANLIMYSAQSGSSPGARVQMAIAATTFAGPTSAKGICVALTNGGSIYTNYADSNGYYVLSLGTSAAVTVVNIQFHQYVTSATGLSFRIKWCQNTSDAANSVTMLQGSRLSVERTT